MATCHLVGIIQGNDGAVMLLPQMAPTLRGRDCLHRTLHSEPYLLGCNYVPLVPLLCAFTHSLLSLMLAELKLSWFVRPEFLVKILSGNHDYICSYKPEGQLTVTNCFLALPLQKKAIALFAGALQKKNLKTGMTETYKIMHIIDREDTGMVFPPLSHPLKLSVELE